MSKDKELSKLDKEFIEDTMKAKGNLDMPIKGSISAPLCKICKNVDMHYGTWDEPECLVYGSIPKEIWRGRTFECKHFMHDKNSSDNFLFNEDLKPKYR